MASRAALETTGSLIAPSERARASPRNDYWLLAESRSRGANSSVKPLAFDCVTEEAVTVSSSSPKIYPEVVDCDKASV